MKKRLKSVVSFVKKQSRHTKLIALGVFITLLVPAITLALHQDKLNQNNTQKNAESTNPDVASASIDGNNTEGGATGDNQSGGQSPSKPGQSGSNNGGASGSNGNVSPSGPALILSSYNITLPKRSATTGGDVYITVSSNAGAINPPATSGYHDVAASELNGLGSPNPEIFRNEYTFRISRRSPDAYGPDSVTFTTKTRDGKALSARLTVFIEALPNFAVTKGPLEKVPNANGTVTYKGHFTLNPIPHFGNPNMHMCIIYGAAVGGPCTMDQFFTYNGNNNLYMSQTITPSTSHPYFNMTIFIESIYSDSQHYMSWVDNY